MQLRTHATIIKNARWFIVLFTVAVGVAAALFSVLRPPSYKAVASFEVQFSNTHPVAEEVYEYGAYYDLKAAEIYTQHLMSLMQTPAVVEQVYQAAGQSYEITSLSQFTNRFRAKQYSAQNFSVELSDYNEDVARGLAQAIGEVITENTTESGLVNDRQQFTVVALPPVVALSEFPLWLVTIVGTIAGLITSVILVYLREYFR